MSSWASSKLLVLRSRTFGSHCVLFLRAESRQKWLHDIRFPASDLLRRNTSESYLRKVTSRPEQLSFPLTNYCFFLQNVFMVELSHSLVYAALLAISARPWSSCALYVTL